MEKGHPRLLSQAGRDTVETFVRDECRGNTDHFRRSDRTLHVYPYYQFYWAGWMYAYLHFKEDILSRDLVQLISIEDMLDKYHLGHEMDKEVFYDHIKEVFEKRKPTGTCFFDTMSV